MAKAHYLAYDPDVLSRLQKAELEVLLELDRICREEGLRYFIQFGALIGAMRHGGPIPWDDDIDIAMPREDYDRFAAYCAAHPESDYAFVNADTNPAFTKYVPLFYRKGTAFAEDAQGMVPGIGIDIFPYDYIADDPAVMQQVIQRANFQRRMLYLRYRSPRIPYGGLKGAAATAICQIARGGLVMLQLSMQRMYRQFEKANRACSERYFGSEQMVCFFSSNPTRSAVRAEQFEVRDLEFSGETVFGPKDPDAVLRPVYGDYMQIPPEDKRVNHCPAILDFGDHAEQALQTTL